MGSWTRIPTLNLASTLAGPIGQLTGLASTAGHKALDGVEVLISALVGDSHLAQEEIRIIQETVEQQIAEYEAQVASQTASTGGGAYSNFLSAKTGFAPTSEPVVPTIDIEALVAAAQFQIDAIAARVNIGSRTALATIMTTLKAVEVSLQACLVPLNILRALIKTLRLPLPALKVLITVLKLLPLPQIYLIVAFTTVESDLLEMLSELVQQVDDELKGLEGIINSIIQTLQPIIDRIRRIRAQIALVGARIELLNASASDQNILDRAGILDKETGDNLLDKIQGGLAGKNDPGSSRNNGHGGCCKYGLGVGNNRRVSKPETSTRDVAEPRTYPDFDIDSPEIGNQIALASSGDYIDVPATHTSGSRIETWYSTGSVEIPDGFPANSGSWFQSTDDPEGIDLDSLWKIDLKYEGDLLYEGLGNDPVHATEEDLNQLKLDSQGGSKVFGLVPTEKIRILGYDNYDQKPGIIKVDDWSELLDVVLDKIRNLPLSQELKDKLDEYWSIQVSSLKIDEDVDDQSSGPQLSDFQYLSKSGEIYNIEVVEDEHSPRVAVRRYARVKDASGVVVLDGVKTFSTDPETLIKEIKLQLDQLTQ